jgi:hypothetical protein
MVDSLTPEQIQERFGDSSWDVSDIAAVLSLDRQTVPERWVIDTCADRTAIRRQLAYYFCNTNLKRDRFFRRLLNTPDAKAHGFPVSILLKCNRIQKLTKSVITLLDACSEVPSISVSGLRVKYTGTFFTPQTAAE